MIKPTIGRKVWFWRSGADVTRDQPEDATIVFVHNDTLVNLHVIDHNGVARAVTSMSLRQPEYPELIENTPCAQWMPYQVKAAGGAP
jgi:hypothetical protein